MIHKTYTTEDLIRFIYKETSAKESIQIAENISSNWNLKEEYLMLRDAYRQLPKAKFSPKKETIKNILDYSSSAKLETC